MLTGRLLLDFEERLSPVLGRGSGFPFASECVFNISLSHGFDLNPPQGSLLRESSGSISSHSPYTAHVLVS